MAVYDNSLCESFFFPIGFPPCKAEPFYEFFIVWIGGSFQSLLAKTCIMCFFIVCKLDNKRRQGLVGQTLDDDGTMQIE